MTICRSDPRRMRTCKGTCGPSVDGVKRHRLLAPSHFRANSDGGRRSVCKRCEGPDPRGNEAAPGDGGRVCTSICRKRLKLEAFASNGRGGLRSVCRRCSSRIEMKRQAKTIAAGKPCVGPCGKVLPLGEFPRARVYRDGGRANVYGTMCRACTAGASEIPRDPVADAEEEFRRCSGQRWALALRDTLEHFGLTVAAYRALRGAGRGEVERAWTARMLRMAKEPGAPFPWAPEWDQPALAVRMAA